MAEIARPYTVNMMTLSPLHVGTGRELMRDYDYVVHRGRTWRVDQDALLDAALGEDDEWNAALLGRPAAELLREEDFVASSKLFRYVARGTPRSQDVGARLREQIKDVWDRPYLPGSSLKGALRTAIFDWALGQRKDALDVNRLDRDRRRAAQRIERALLGRDPNHDLLRALQVGDSQPVRANASLSIENAQVLTGGEPGSPIEIEAVRPEVRLRAEITLDLSLFSPEAERTLQMGSRLEWLTGLMGLCRARVTPILLAEQEWYEARYPGSAVARLYGSLCQIVEDLPDERALLQIGWGGGWGSKTVGGRLTESEREDVISRYRLARGKRRPGDPFPKSRRVVLDREGQPAAPLGWVLIEMKAKG